MTADNATCMKEFLGNNKGRFGILENVPDTEYLNIAVKNVKFTAAKQIHRCWYHSFWC